MGDAAKRLEDILRRVRTERAEFMRMLQELQHGGLHVTPGLTSDTLQKIAMRDRVIAELENVLGFRAPELNS